MELKSISSSEDMCNSIIHQDIITDKLWNFCDAVRYYVYMTDMTYFGKKSTHLS